APEWRNRAAMMVPSDSFATAYADYVRALRLDATDTASLEGFVRAAVATGRQKEALDLLRSLAITHPTAPAVRTAMSKLLAVGGSFDEAIREAERACDIKPPDPRALEQFASILSDLGDASRLDGVVQQLQRLNPERASTPYYAAAAKFLRGQFADAID